MRVEVVTDTEVDKKTAKEYFPATIQKYTVSILRLSVWMEENRLKRDSQKNVSGGCLPERSFLLRLYSALLMEISMEWQIGKHYYAARRSEN